jgi:hypothetical protein
LRKLSAFSHNSSCIKKVVKQLTSSCFIVLIVVFGRVSTYNLMHQTKMFTRNEIFFILRPRYKNTTYFFQLPGITLQFVSVSVPGYNILWGVVAVIVWKLDLQLPMLRSWHKWSFTCKELGISLQTRDIHLVPVVSENCVTCSAKPLATHF